LPVTLKRHKTVGTKALSKCKKLKKSYTKNIFEIKIATKV